MRNTINMEELGESFIFSTIIRVKCDDLLIKIFFNKRFIATKNGCSVRFLFERIKPDIFSKVINKDNIIFKTIM